MMKLTSLALAALVSSPVLAEEAWHQKVSLSGVVEIEASSAKDYAGTSSSDLVAATFELGMAAQINNSTSAEVVLLFEEDETPLDVDTAAITIGDPDALHYTAGRMVVPFGRYDTALLSDPITLGVGETHESALKLGWAGHGAGVAIYAFNGDAELEGKDNTVSGLGAEVSYSMKSNPFGLDIALGYISNIADSDGMPDSQTSTPTDGSEATTTLLKKTIPGMAVSLGIEIAGAKIGFEMVSANDKFEKEFLTFKDDGAKPSVWHGELSYGLEVGGKGLTIALASEASEQSQSLELPKSSTLIGVGYDLNDNIALGVEHRMDKDYAESDGGTGKDGSATTLRLASSF